MKLLTLVFTSLLLFTLSIKSYARMEYAAKHRINRCTTCHISPVGGSIRNTTGKAYGQHGFAPGPFAKQDYFSADFRLIHYQPENHTSNMGGAGIMNGQVGINVPVTSLDSAPYEIRLVYAHNIGGFTRGGNSRNAFIRWKFSEDTETSFLPQYALVGRFHAPFGILTDEHRTYVRMQNRTGWNDFEMGALFSANPFESIHYDIALVNGVKTGGTGFGAGRSADWGSVLNLRYAPAWVPLFIGGSYSHHSVDTANSPLGNPKSLSAYAVVAFQRWVSWLPITLSLEHQESSNFNEGSDFMRYLDVTGSYQTTIAGAKSVGKIARVEYGLSQNLTLIYQYDSLLLNKDFTGDTYLRNGVGARWTMGPGTILNIRQEWAHGGTNTETAANSMAKQRAFWLVLQLGI